MQMKRTCRLCMIYLRSILYIWLSVMGYLCHKWSRISYTCRKHFPVLSSFMTCTKSITTGASSRTGTATLPEHLWSHPEFQWGLCYSIFIFTCMFCRSFFVLLSFFFWPLCCLYLNLRILLPIWYLTSLPERLGKL